MGGYSLFYDYYCGVASHHTHTRGNTAHLKQLPIFGKRRPQSYYHTANKTQRFFLTENIYFIKKNEWPPMSPDLNPMDYAIWPALRELVYFQQIEPFTEEELVEKICESRNEI